MYLMQYKTNKNIDNNDYEDEDSEDDDSDFLKSDTHLMYCNI